MEWAAAEEEWDGGGGGGGGNDDWGVGPDVGDDGAAAAGAILPAVAAMPPELALDVDELNRRSCYEAATELLPGVGVRVFVGVPLGVLQVSDSQLRAWGFEARTRGDRVVAAVTFGAKYTQGESAPTRRDVESFQLRAAEPLRGVDHGINAAHRLPYRLGWLVQSRLCEWLSEQWPLVGARRLSAEEAAAFRKAMPNARALQEMFSVPLAEAIEVLQASRFDLSAASLRLEGAARKPATPPRPAAARERQRKHARRGGPGGEAGAEGGVGWEAALQRLRELFPERPSEDLSLALLQSQLSVDHAAALLLDDIEFARLRSLADAGRGGALAVASFGALAVEADGDEAKAAALAAGAEEEVEAGGAVVLRSAHDLADHNMLAALAETLVHLLMTASTRCMLCGEVLEFPGVRPTTCSRQLCQFKFLELGLGLDLLSELRALGSAVDLLITFCYAAASSDAIHSFFPKALRVGRGAGFDGGGGGGGGVEDEATMSLSLPDGKADCKAIMRALDVTPRVSAMAACDSNAELQSLLDDRSPLVAPLLRWLLFSNPAVVRPLRPAERFEAVPTPHQFVLLTAGPGKESEWRALRDEAERKMGRGRGSVYMFHGSPLHNWHSILRTGLQVRGLPGLGASGAAIWMANEMTTSVGYSLKARSTVWDASVFPRDAMCMGLLEVVHDRAKDVSPEKDVCVVPDVRLIMTRFFFILSARECSRCHGQGRAALPRAERLPKRSFDSL